MMTRSMQANNAFAVAWWVDETTKDKLLVAQVSITRMRRELQRPARLVAFDA